MTTPSRSLAREAERGFALVGVIMFILVLTILGLSLFSLTGYEAQFMQHSTDNAESFQAAAGGIDRARFALARMSHLESVKDGLPLDGVVYAVARRGNDTTGVINWDDPTAPDIMIRVKAVKNGETHFLEAMFDPSRAQSLYKRLFSLSAAGPPDSSGLRVIRNDPAESASTEENYWGTWLYGECRQNDDNVPEMIYPFGNPPQSATLSLSLGNVPTPDVNGFLNDHWATATEARVTGQRFWNLNASGAPDSVQFFKTTWTGGAWSWDFDLSGPQWNRFDQQITVGGTAIWMFDHGMRSEGTVYVSGSGHANDLLVIVAKPGSDPETFNSDPAIYNFHRSLAGAGVALLGSISSTIPVIVVSSGGVLLENRDFGLGPADEDDKTATTVNCLSIFAPYARVMGPDNDAGGYNTRMIFTRNATDRIDPRINRLTDLGLLPNTAAGLKGKLRFLAGSWREVDETNPP